MSFSHPIFKCVLLCSFLISCKTTHNAKHSLYDQLGGMPAIKSITFHLVNRLFDNKDIGFLFEDSDKKDLINHISKQICIETGGPCHYQGRSMVEVHSGLDIHYSEFDVFVQEFIAAMKDANIPFTLQNRVLSLFAVMRDDVTHQ